MIRPPLLRLALASALVLAGSAPRPVMAQGTIEDDVLTLSSREILERAFENRYDCDLSAEIELVMRSRTGSERRRIFESAVKKIDGRYYSLGRLIAPQDLRGMAIMNIENLDRMDDSFVYLPSLGKVRRVTTAYRGDSFLGSDLTYEDFERHQVDDYTLDPPRSARLEGEEIYVVPARPNVRRRYDRVEFAIAATDWAILEIRYFKRGPGKPFRVIQARRDSMLRAEGRILPTHLIARNELRGTTTEVRIRNLVINPELDPALFSTWTLERERTILPANR